jgi:hypothetical protein
MANNQKKLKAFVRYDGSGRVVASSLILRKNKPRVGRWYEIPEYLCCNGTIDTTTTQGGGGVTPTAWFGQISNSGVSDQWKACNGFGNSIVVYTSTSTNPLPPGTYLYSDAALTTLIPYAFGAISIQGTVYIIENGRTNPLGTGEPCAGITTTTSTTIAPSISVSAIGAFNAADACAGQGNPLTLYYSNIGTPLTNGTALFYDAALTSPYNPGQWLVSGSGTYLRIYFSGQDQVCSMNGNIVTSAGPCSTTPTIDYSVASTCFGQPGLDPGATVNNFSGTLMGTVYVATPKLTQQEALNNIFLGVQYSNSFPFTFGQTGGLIVGQTYWVAVQDANNAANVLAKSFVVTSCS